MATLPDGTELPGKLFIVEGIDGSGKSTQLDLVHKWLTTSGYLVAFSEWNSSPLVAKATKRGKKKQLLTPTTFSLMHAVDFSQRFQQQILPALRAGAPALPRVSVPSCKPSASALRVTCTTSWAHSSSTRWRCCTAALRPTVRPRRR